MFYADSLTTDELAPYKNLANKAVLEMKTELLETYPWGQSGYIKDWIGTRSHLAKVEFFKDGWAVHAQVSIPTRGYVSPKMPLGRRTLYFIDLLTRVIAE